MASFQFKETRKTLDIQGPDGTVIKTYTLDIGNYETLKNMGREIKRIETAGEKINADSADEESFEELISIMREVIPVILGEGSFDVIWEACRENIISCLAFTNYLAEFVTEQIEEVKKAYV